MMGWCVCVFRQRDGGSAAATVESKEGQRLAIWQTHVSGLRWFMELLRAKGGVDLGGNGYPDRFTLQAEHLIPHIFYGPPEANAVWSLDEHDVVLDNWVGKTLVDRVACAGCEPGEWLLVEAWDES